MKVPFLDLGALHAPIAEAILADWAQLVSSSAFVGGDHVERFEHEWAQYCGTGHAVGVANGTDAIELLLRALDIGPGDEVIVPTNTFVATAAAVVATGARPRFVDVDPDTLLLRPDIVADAIGPSTAAVIAVHLYGNMPDMPALAELCARTELALVEDAAQAHGASQHGRRAGSWGHGAAFSFYPGKNLGAFGDAGAVTTADPLLASRVRQLRDHGRSARDRNAHEIVGRNSRLDALQAVVLHHKLAHLDAWNSARRRTEARYRARLPVTVGTIAAHDRTEPVHHLMVVQVDDRDAVLTSLRARGVEASVHYPVPCHRHPAFAAHAGAALPTAEGAARRILSLPIHPTQQDHEVDYVCRALVDVMGGAELSVRA